MLTLAVASFATLAAIWLGYPAVIALVALLRPRRSGVAHDPAPTVTAVLATRDDADAVGQRVADLLAGEYPGDRLEVIVARDATATAVLPPFADPRVRIVAGDPPGGKAATLNAGVRAARGDLLVFADAHQRFSPDAIPALVRALGDARVGAASGMLDTATRGASLSVSDVYWLYERRLRQAEARVHSSVGVTGAIYAMRRALWAPLPSGLILDDLYVPMRLVLAGHRVDFVAEARAVDTRRFKAEQEYRRKVRTLTGVLQLCAWLPGVLVPWRNPVWAQFICHKLLRLLSPYLLLLGLLGAAGAAVPLLRGGVPLAAALGLAGAVLVGLAVSAALRRRVLGQLAWGVGLQRAIVVATYNGLRGRWDVWH